MIKLTIKGLPTNNRMADKPLSAAVGLPAGLGACSGCSGGTGTARDAARTR
jgi:hypothetical protein